MLNKLIVIIGAFMVSAFPAKAELLQVDLSIFGMD